MTEEAAKGYWHAGLGVIFGATGAHNLVRLIVTRHPRNAVNVLLYGALVYYELRQAKRHWRDDGR